MTQTASQPQLLDVMKNSLRGLEDTTLINPDDVEILSLRRMLRQKIDELEMRQGLDSTLSLVN
jgi:hypothetical protein